MYRYIYIRVYVYSRESLGKLRACELNPLENANLSLNYGELGPALS